MISILKTIYPKIFSITMPYHFLVFIELQDKRVEFKGKTMTDDGKSRPDFLMLALLFKVSSTENTIRADAVFYLGTI